MDRPAEPLPDTAAGVDPAHRRPGRGAAACLPGGRSGRPGGPRRARRRMAAALAAGLLSAGLAGCAGAGYYGQAVQGHLALMAAARPVQDWLDDPQTPPALRARLTRAQALRAFAVETLHLPDNASYRRYAALDRPAAVWNVVAAPPDALTLHRWCYPVLGCVGYRGYFREADARAEAARLAAQGLEVSVYGVPAYSTLGWLNAFGGDPLLSTFVTADEDRLARLLFHELAHQRVYVPDDTAFNESFATAVERLGLAAWRAREGDSAAAARDAAREARRQDFRALTRRTRQALAIIYEEKSRLPSTGRSWIAMKNEVMAGFREAYATLRAGWGGDASYDDWVAQANNASLAAQGAYEDLVPGFERLHARHGGDWPRFYDAVERLAARQPAERRAALAGPPAPVSPP